MASAAELQRYRIGYALTPKKEKSFIQPSLVAESNERGIDLMRIDPDKPLTEQGPFDCIIHKLFGRDWTHQLQQFSSINPNVPIVDSPEPVERLHNRITMLDVVAELKTNFVNEKFGAPNQAVVSREESLRRDNAIEELKLRFPVIAKPLVADGSVDSHKMYLIFDEEGLRSVTAPIILQEFVNHGGFIFKVYVVGLKAKCVKRRSLSDISEEKLKSLKGSLPFSQISNLVDNHKKDGDDNYYNEVNLERVEMPSETFVMELARALREALGLNLFNFDIIRDARDSNRYLIIDINYFPGYAKMPCFESIVTDFFLQVLNKKSNESITREDK